MDMLLIILFVLCLALVNFRLTRDHSTYRYTTSRHQRACKVCKQVQVAVCWEYTEYGHEIWEAFGDIKNPACNCHKDCS